MPTPRIPRPCTALQSAICGLLLSLLLSVNAFAQSDETPDDLLYSDSQTFSVRAGGLRSNVRKLAADWGWQLVAWDETVQRDGKVIDWRIWVDYQFEAESIDAALEQLIGPYGLHARLYEADSTVVIYLPHNAPPLDKPTEEELETDTLLETQQ